MKTMHERADELGLLTGIDDGKTPWRVGTKVWYRPKRSRKWRQGSVTYSIRRPRFDFVRVDWVLAAEVSAEPPEGMCPHGYLKRFKSDKFPPCPRCRRAYFQEIADNA